MYIFVNIYLIQSHRQSSDCSLYLLICLQKHCFVIELTEEEILANGLTFFLAGYDTTANTMSFVGYYLAANTDIQDKVIAEIDEVIGDRVGRNLCL